MLQGDVVATAMGGMGRDFNGGYAEYTCVPAKQVQVGTRFSCCRRRTNAAALACFGKFRVHVRTEDPACDLHV